MAVQNDIELGSKVDQDLIIDGNKQFLQRLIGNLLDNAIKYTSAGGKVTIDHEVCGKDVLIRIADTGMGIRQEDLANIFERFYRCDLSRSKPGTGLGLAIVRDVAEIYGGEVELGESEDLGGLLVRLSLPRANSLPAK